jgi:hypothetical protein
VLLDGRTVLLDGRTVSLDGRTVSMYDYDGVMECFNVHAVMSSITEAVNGSVLDELQWFSDQCVDLAQLLKSVY